MIVYIILAQPKDDTALASIMGVYADESVARIELSILNEKASARKNSASRHWTYELTAEEVQK